MHCDFCNNDFNKHEMIGQKNIFDQYEHYCQSCFDHLIKGEEK